MEPLGDYIVPIVVVIIWIVGKLFGAKLGEDEAPPPSQPRSTDQAERARQIQEEIRRKIEERRRESQGQQSASGPPPVPQERPAESPTQPQVSQQQPPLVAAPVEDYQAQLRQRQQEIEAAQARVAAARKEANTRIARARGGVGAVEGSSPELVSLGGSPASFIRAALSSPLSTRNAFVFQEVVGPPVALRTTERIGAVEF